LNQASRRTAGSSLAASSAPTSEAYARNGIGPRSATSERSPSTKPSGVIATTRHSRVLNGIGTENRGASASPSAARLRCASRSTMPLASSDQPR